MRSMKEVVKSAKKLERKMLIKASNYGPVTQIAAGPIEKRAVRLAMQDTLGSQDKTLAALGRE